MNQVRIAIVGIALVFVAWARQFATGVEYMWGKSRATNDALGAARRIQWMARFDF